MDENKIDDVVTRAADVFWRIVANSYPEIKTGDFPPELEAELTNIMKKSVTMWIKINQNK